MVEIAGVYMDRSLNDFARGCEVYIEEEQAKFAPDNALIALLCDGVRLTREMTAVAQRHSERPQTPESIEEAL